MAGEIFDLDVSDLAKLTGFYARAPRQFAEATGKMLNEFAFGTRNTAIEVIREKMTVRNPRFVTSRLQVDRSSTRLPIQAQQAVVGSVATKRFSGWEEQQTGKRSTRTRTVNLLARLGSPKRQVAPRARMKPGKDFEKYSNFPGGSPNMRSTKMLQTLDRRRHKKPFFLTKKRGVTPGLWIFKGRKLRPLQLFKRGQRVERIPWMTDAESRYFRRENIQALWARTLKTTLR